MELKYREEYSSMSDGELIDRIVGRPCDGLAADFLILIKYNPLLRRIYNEVFDIQKSDWFEDCKSDLKEYLMGKDMSWSKLVSIKNKDSISSWLEITARHRFTAIKPNLIGKYPEAISIDDEDPEKPLIQIPVDEERIYDDRERVAVVMEALTTLNPTERFCIIKDLNEVEHKYIAEMLKIKWQREGIKIKSSKKSIDYVEPDADYVNVQIQRAKKKILKYYNKVYNK